AVRKHRAESMTLQQALRRGLDKFLSILGANILLTVIIFGLILTPILLIFPAIALGSGNPSGVLALICGLFVGLIVGGFVAIFVYVACSLYPPAIMMENESAIGGLSRSWAITKGYRWSLFGAILVAAILTGLVSAAITLPVDVIQDRNVRAVVRIVASAIASGIVGAWFVILAAVAYDLIVRQPPSLFGAPPPYAPGVGYGPTPGIAPSSRGFSRTAATSSWSRSRLTRASHRTGPWESSMRAGSARNSGSSIGSSPTSRPSGTRWTRSCPWTVKRSHVAIVAHSGGTR